MWIEARRENVEHYKKVKANRVKTVNHIEIWKDAYGYHRLIVTADNGRIYISPTDYLSLDSAEHHARMHTMIY